MSPRFLPSRALPLFSLAILAACGSPPEAKTPPPAPVVQTPKDPPVDLSPVPDPPALVVIARVNKPETLVKTVGDWAHLPLPGAKELVRSISNDALADVIDASQPLDIAGTLSISSHGVEPQYAFSIGIKSFDEAKTKIGAKWKMDPVPNGGFKVRNLLDKGPPAPSRDGDNGDSNSDDDDICVLAHAAAGAKLICGPNSSVENLVPYLSRTMPRKEWPSDVHIEVHPDPLRGPLSDMRGMLPLLAKNAIGTNSAAVKDMIEGSVNEAIDIIDDSQKLTLDAMVAPSGINETARWEFQGNKSVFARSLSDAGRADTAPAAFWHLPAETDTAVFMRGSDPKLYDHPREILTNLMMEGMDSAGMPEAEKKSVHDLVSDRMLKVFMDGGTGIFARGYDQAALEKAIKDRAALPREDWNADHEGQRLVGEQIVGWNLYQVSEPIAQVGPILKDWSSLWNRPAFAKWIETKTGTKAQEMPRMRLTPAPAGVTLPKDAVHLEVTFPPEPEPKWSSGRPGSSDKKPTKKYPPAKAIVAHVYAVPDGASTWIAFGLDGKLVGTKVAQSLASAPDTNTLGKAGPAGLDDLKNGKLNGGGFATMRGLLAVTAMGRDDEGGHPNMFTQANGLPKKGAAPIVFTGKAEAPSATARSGANTSSLKISRDVIEDVVKLIFANAR